MGLSRGGAGSMELASLFRDGAGTGLSDAELLARFLEGREGGAEVAFRAILARHGAMVLRNCRRILRDPADADDAFQATFLVLVRRARDVRVGTSLGPWLYSVSVRVARRIGVRRSRRELVLAQLELVQERSGRAVDDVALNASVADAIGELPPKYGEAVSLCYLNGLTHEEAAGRIGCPVGTVRSRLARGRALLKERLRELWVGNGGLWWSYPRAPRGEMTSITVEPPLVELTVRAAGRVAVGEPMGAVVSSGVASIVQGIIQAMKITKVAVVSVMLLTTAWAGWGALTVGATLPGFAEPPIAESAATVVEAARADELAQVVLEEPPATKRAAAKEPELEALAKLPAVVVKVEPAVGAREVDPGVREIRVTFSREMMDGTWSWTSGNIYATPKTDGKIHYEKDRRTCVMPVKLEPGKTYVLGINSERHHNFKDSEGRPALPYLVVFRTKGTR